MLVSAGEDALGIPDPFCLGRLVGTNRPACTEAGTMTSSAGGCALATCHALRMESTSSPTDRHETSLSESAVAHLARQVGAKCLPGTAQPPGSPMGPCPSVPAKTINTVAGHFLPSAERPAQLKFLVSPSLIAKPPSGSPRGVRSSDTGSLQ